jgi:hypothetical protein
MIEVTGGKINSLQLKKLAEIDDAIGIERVEYRATAALPYWLVTTEEGLKLRVFPGGKAEEA